MCVSVALGAPASRRRVPIVGAERQAGETPALPGKARRMESLHVFSSLHWDHEPRRGRLLVPRGASWSAAALRRFRSWRGEAEKRHGTGALQNLRNLGRFMERKPSPPGPITSPPDLVSATAWGSNTK